MSSLAASTTLWTPPTISVQRSSTEVGSQHQPRSAAQPAVTPSSVDAQWSNNFWVTLSDPQVSNRWRLQVQSFGLVSRLNADNHLLLFLISVLDRLVQSFMRVLQPASALGSLQLAILCEFCWDVSPQPD